MHVCRQSARVTSAVHTPRTAAAAAAAGRENELARSSDARTLRLQRHRRRQQQPQHQRQRSSELQQQQQEQQNKQQEAPQQPIQLLLPLDSAPATTQGAEIFLRQRKRHMAMPEDGILLHNPKIDAVEAPIVGPLTPLQEQQGGLQNLYKKRLCGDVEPAHLSKVAFDAEYHKFASKGVATDPSDGAATAAAAEGEAAVEAPLRQAAFKPLPLHGEISIGNISSASSSVKTTRKERKACRLQRNTDVESEEFQGPWALYVHPATAAAEAAAAAKARAGGEDGLQGASSLGGREEAAERGDGAKAEVVVASLHGSSEAKSSASVGSAVGAAAASLPATSPLDTPFNPPSLPTGGICFREIQLAVSSSGNSRAAASLGPLKRTTKSAWAVSGTPQRRAESSPAAGMALSNCGTNDSDCRWWREAERNLRFYTAGGGMLHRVPFQKQQQGMHTLPFARNNRTKHAEKGEK
ncbi:uncharacterized protein LOC34623041 [Cyclospora cayetanensis]|uniref:Uncharacterized protein LOC34623041 n=1 Tax=Cyclospora cayetanensis TaxID=88456 RepID=A0A6P6RRC6_9EIME|nr:uncharacterized protein LOC34623041 [Cyclospora cayetanensis]